MTLSKFLCEYIITPISKNWSINSLAYPLWLARILLEIRWKKRSGERRADVRAPLQMFVLYTEQDGRVKLVNNCLVYVNTV